MATTTGPRTRITLSAAALALALALLQVVASGPAVASGDPAATLHARINAERSARGLAPVASAADLRAVALDHSRSMAASGDLHHNPALGSDVTNWRVVAENVGVGPDADDLHRKFMQSSSHAANILDGRVTQVGLGVVQADGLLWVTQVFRQPMTAPASDPAPPSTPPAPATPRPSDTAASEPGTTPPARAPAADADADPEPASEPQIGVAAATVTRVAPAPGTVGGAAAEPTTTAPAPAPGGIEGLLTTAVRWVTDLF